VQAILYAAWRADEREVLLANQRFPVSDTDTGTGANTENVIDTTC